MPPEVKLGETSGLGRCPQQQPKTNKTKRRCWTERTPLGTSWVPWGTFPPTTTFQLHLECSRLAGLGQYATSSSYYLYRVLPKTFTGFCFTAKWTSMCIAKSSFQMPRFRNQPSSYSKAPSNLFLNFKWENGGWWSSQIHGAEWCPLLKIGRKWDLFSPWNFQKITFEWHISSETRICFGPLALHLGRKWPFSDA